MKAKFGAEFPFFDKIDVNGKNAHPLYVFLKSKRKGFMTNNIKWNFSKFLCVKGVPVKRYAPTSNPLSFEADIQKALSGEKL